jgi:hypothetical protein
LPVPVFPFCSHKCPKPQKDNAAPARKMARLLAAPGFAIPVLLSYCLIKDKIEFHKKKLPVNNKKL